jgi:hypothetical protein
MNTDIASSAATAPALQRLVNREEVLQICYWFQGEGFGDRYEAALLRPFLNCDEQAIHTALGELAERGDLESVGAGGYRFTAKGRGEAGRLFADSFADFQKQGHGECDAGCCDGDDHSRCGDECALH